MMKNSYWIVQIEKSNEGKVCLKYWGYLNISAKHKAYVVTVLAVFGSAISYVIHYFI